MAENNTPIAGADGCRAGWVVVRRNSSGAIAWSVSTRLSTVLDHPDAPDVLALDIPIGLPEVGYRNCDHEARRLLGRRASSVFSAPIRPVLGASSYVEACNARFQVEGKRVSQQAWAIVPKIREVDALLRANRAARSRVREVHPEVCFYYMAGERPMGVSKKKSAGREERASLLRSVFGSMVDEALKDRSLLGCAVDDVLDAFAALWSANRIQLGTAVCLPQNPQRDGFGLPMEMVA